jgi:hypothetical protein
MNNVCVEEPRLRWVKASRAWQLEDPVCWLWNGVLLEVPVGFQTDLASVPRPLTGVIQRSGCWNRAVILHDWAFFWRGRLPELARVGASAMTRREADRLMLDVMRHDGVGWFYRNAMYTAVRAWPGNWRAFS